MGRTDGRDTSRALAILLLVGLFVLGTSWVGILLTREGGRVASLWLANAGALAVLLRRSPDARPSTLAVVYLANVAANLMSGDGAILALAMASCNIAEILIALVLLTRDGDDGVDMTVMRSFRRFLIVAGVYAPLASACAASLILWIITGIDPGAVVWRWFLADSLGMVMVAPLLLSARATDFKELLTPEIFGEAIAVLALATGVTLIIFLQSTYPLLFIILPTLTLAAFRLRFAGAAMAVTCVAATATLLTLEGMGPIAHIVPEMSDRVVLLQVFIAVAVLTTLPVSSILTERAALQAELSKAHAEAQHALAAKSAFLATMSHEIRTPMTGVPGMIELLRGDPPAKDKERFFATLEQSANLLMRVLDDILDFSKMESGKVALEAVDFDLQYLARATLDLFDNAASSKGLTLSLSFSAGSSQVRGDPVRVQQVLANLVSNAIKFTDRGSVELVVIAGERDGERQMWTVHVRDSGIGIEQAQISRLFSPFVQADTSTTRRFGGTGLGLAISRSLVAAMGGALRVESSPGHGSTFSFTIALERGRGSAATVVTDPAQKPTRCLNVLLAEDNAVNQLLMRTLLYNMGHRVTCVGNGQLAVDAAARESFDVILMDMQMPVMDGLAATRAIRAREDDASTHVPIIALTADASPDRRRFYDNAGLTAFLTKPVDSAGLRAQLNRIAAEPRRDRTGPVLDCGRLDELVNAIGAERVASLLDLFARDLTERPAEIARLALCDDRPGLRAEAHSLRGAATSMGALWLTVAIADVEAADGCDSARLGLLCADLEHSAGETLRALYAYRAPGPQVAQLATTR